MNVLLKVVDFVLHLNKYLSEIISQYGGWTYGLLFFVIFMETGFVVTPFLPGDSLIFAAATFAATGVLNPWLIFGLCATAAVLGDTANYWIGHRVGAKAYTGEVKWVKKEYMERTHAFFEKHGGMAIFLARFVPIIRTFAPFVAGIGNMSYGYFISYNVFGGIAWVGLFTAAGYLFGNIPFIREHFSLVVIAIVVVSVLPMVVEAIRSRRESKQGAAA